jgi:probable HAF family extracellular repeat protein
LGTTSTAALGINNAGQIVGSYSDSGLKGHGFLYTNGTYTALDDPSANVVNTGASGINDLGQVVGLYNTLTNVDFFQSFVFRYSGGTYTTVIGGALSPNPTGINNAGDIIGTELSDIPFLYNSKTDTSSVLPFIPIPGKPHLSYLPFLEGILRVHTTHGQYACIYDPKGKTKTIKPCAWTRKDMLSK